VPSNIVYCEMCGKPIDRRYAKIVYIEGAKLVLCPSCFSKVAKRTVESVPMYKRASKPTRSVKPVTTSKPRPRRQRLDEYEVVSNYSEIVRRARERLGWSQRTLAEAVKEGENVIKRIETGRLVPSIDLARRLEKVLGVKLLEPVVEEFSANLMPSHRVKELTLGDIVNIKKKGSGK